MDLYGDLPPAEGENSAGVADGWARTKSNLIPRAQQMASSANAFKPSTLISAKTTSNPNPKLSVSGAFKPRQAVQTPQSTVRSGIASAPVVVIESVKQLPKSEQTIPIPKIERETIKSTNVSNVQNVTTFDVLDPYDPKIPNDYLAWCEERLEKRRLAKLDAENVKKLKELDHLRQEKERERAEAIEQGDLAKLQASMGAGRGRGRGGVTNLPAWMTQGTTTLNAPTVLPPATNGPLVSKQADVAQFENPETNHSGYDDRDSSENRNVGSQMMSRMGYRDGEGLGRDGQGIVRPIEHRSTGGGRGQLVVDDDDRQRIAHRLPPAVGGRAAAALAAAAAAAGPGQLPRKKQGLFSNPSCVVLLKNMVGPGEVDEILAEETKQECEKFGPVVRCVVHEVEEDNCPDEECVRTFVAFDRQESAVRAYREMNGRFFAGRQITASFYDEIKFERGELAPAPGEW